MCDRASIVTVSVVYGVPIAGVPCVVTLGTGMSRSSGHRSHGLGSFGGETLCVTFHCRD